MSLEATIIGELAEHPLTLHYHLIFEYKDGELYWKDSPNNKVKKGSLAGSVDVKGYLRVRVNGKWLMQHRVVWVMHHGDIPHGMQIDHINHNRTDNRIDNLRVVDGIGNGRNRTQHKNNSSGATGVYFKPSHRKWGAQIRVKGKNKHLGYFASIEDAIASRKAAEVEYNFHENHGAIK
ncbi:HNH endonuclease [Pantoea sp. ACRSB]|uniref:HNH endonuclease n=1 Tax=Pantoea sp. ACRSB TaxID=2918207 RepID=UPI002892D4F1|nr:HNH endonuclease [Pantoea sp. ACRSB]MCG7388318.1 HNH endonuclease [Pantoea sp. ACRSB]